MGLGSKLWMSHNKNTNFETLTLIDEDTIIVINGESDKNIEIQKNSKYQVYVKCNVKELDNGICFNEILFLRD